MTNATRGVRGATTVESNEASAILERTVELLRLLVDSNGIRAEEVASAIFTVTEDLDAEFPALAARSLPGWEEVPLLCGREIPVPGSLGRCVRILIHWNTTRSQREVRHTFLRGARELRPAWAVRVPGDEPAVVARLPGPGRTR
jgi:chorismate mutase